MRTSAGRPGCDRGWARRNTAEDEAQSGARALRCTRAERRRREAVKQRNPNTLWGLSWYDGPYEGAWSPCPRRRTHREGMGARTVPQATCVTPFAERAVMSAAPGRYTSLGSSWSRGNALTSPSPSRPYLSPLPPPLHRVRGPPQTPDGRAVPSLKHHGVYDAMPHDAGRTVKACASARYPRGSRSQPRSTKP